jgi:hypothetical protein
MKITRDVMTDLLPAFHAGEASADTRALIEEYCRQDPEFARLANVKQASNLLGTHVHAALPKEQELETLVRARAALRLRSFWLAFAIAFTLFPLNCTFNSKGLVWIMIRDAPAFAETCIIIAIFCWVMFFRSRRKVRATGV